MWPHEPTIEDNGIDIDDWDQKIYRIYTRERFIELIRTGKNALVQPQKWDDPMENFFLNSRVRTREGEIGSLESLASSWYGQCWSLKPESDAMWRIYSHDKSGIKVSTTIRKLFTTIYDENDSFRRLKFFIGKVSYKTREDIEEFLANTSFTDLAMGGQSDNFARTLLTKRLEFNHEAEVRILFQDISSHQPLPAHVDFKFDQAAVIEEIVVDPRMNEAEFQSTTDELKSVGCIAPISQSVLYKVDVPIIQL